MDFFNEIIKKKKKNLRCCWALNSKKHNFSSDDIISEF